MGASPAYLRRGGQLRILPQHLPLELLQLRRRVEAELVGEREPRRPVDLERLGLPAAAIERDHQLAAQPLAERVRGDQRLELADERRVPAQRELGVDPLLERCNAQLVQPRRFAPRELLLVEIGERRTAPEGERLGQERRPRGRVRAEGGRQQPFEAVGVDSFRLERQPVARSLRQHDVAAERLAEGRDGVLERPGRRGGRPLAPQIGDEPVGRDDFARAQRERGQQRALLPARQSNRPARRRAPRARRGGEFPLPGCNTENKGFQVSAR